MFTILFVALFLGSGLVMLVVLTSVGVWQRRACTTELQHCADHPEVTLSPSCLLASCCWSTCCIIQPSATPCVSQRRYSTTRGTTLSYALQLCTAVAMQLDAHATSMRQEEGGPQQPPIEQVVIVEHPDGCQSVTIVRQQLKPLQQQTGC